MSTYAGGGGGAFLTALGGFQRLPCLMAQHEARHVFHGTHGLLLLPQPELLPVFHSEVLSKGTVDSVCVASAP